MKQWRQALMPWIARSLWGGRIALLACALALVAASQIQAQDYRFAVDRNISQVTPRADGSADVEYWLTFTCAPGAHAIDGVDIGLPNSFYDLKTARAWYSAGSGDGPERELAAISRSPYIDVGVAVDLGAYAIQPGEQGTIRFQVNVPRLVYPDSQDKGYASVEFAPTYFGREFVQGTTYLEIRFVFPPGVTSDETRYHGRPFDAVDQAGDRIVFIYTYPEARGSETHQHGISFPNKYVDSLYAAPTQASTPAANVLGGAPSGFVKTWRRFGYRVQRTFERSGPLGWLLLTALVGGGLFGVGRVNRRRRKMSYLPPTLSVEGAGIKRGLTAVEAAILIEKPLNMILTMILFGVLKKRGVVVDQDPLKLDVVQPKPEANWRFYENRFLNSVQGDGTLDEQGLQQMLVDLVKAVNQKLKGFSRKETAAYYRDIVERAWQQVRAGATPEIKSEHLDRGLEWMMLDADFERRTNELFRGDPVPMPPWWAYYRPWRSYVQSARVNSGSGAPVPGGGLSPSGGAGGDPAGEGRQLALPTLPGSAFAGAIVTSIERTAGGIVSRLEAFTGGVTGKTNPIPVSSHSGSSGRSSFRSGGCACACACACAGCACACAGGGR